LWWKRLPHGTTPNTGTFKKTTTNKSMGEFPKAKKNLGVFFFPLAIGNFPIGRFFFPLAMGKIPIQRFFFPIGRFFFPIAMGKIPIQRFFFPIGISFVDTGISSEETLVTMRWPTKDEPSLLENIGNFLVPFVCVLPFFNLHAPLWVAAFSAWGIFRLRSAPNPRQKSAARSLL